MKRICLASLVLVFSFTATASPSAGGDPKQRAEEILTQSIDAMGGISLLRSIESISYESLEHTFFQRIEVSDSLPEVIVYESHEVIFQPRQRNLSEKIDSRDTEGPAQTSSQLTMTPQGGFTETNGKKNPISGDDFYTALDTVAANPISTLLSAYDSPDIALEKQSNETYEIAFPQTVYGQEVKTTFGIGKQTHLLQWIEIEHSYSQFVFDAFWGPTAKRFVFSGWCIDVSGLHLPTKWQVVTRGRVESQESMFDLKINPAVPASRFSIPEEFKNSFEALLHATAEELAKHNHGDGVHLDVYDGIVMLPGRSGAYNSFVVKQDNGTVVIESPYSIANSEYDIQYANKAFPGSPVTGVVSTNQLQFHLAGLPACAKEHIPIYVLDSNIDLVRNFLTIQTTQDPIRGADLRLRVIKGRTEIGAGPNRMILIPFRGTASARMMAVYFPERKLLYCSDMYLPKQWGGQYWTEHLGEIQEFIDREHLDVLQVSGVSMVPHDWKQLSALIPVPHSDSEGSS